MNRSEMMAAVRSKNTKPEMLERRILRLESYIRHWEEMNGKRPKEQSDGAPEVDKAPAKPRAKKGQVLAHVEAVLNSGGESDAVEISEAIFSRFNVRYGRSTIYNALAQGEKKGRLMPNGKKWKRNPMLLSQQTTQ